jgi:uncharacterized radical SAM protein YgiQ
MAGFSFLPMFPEEVARRGWDGLDVLLVSGDAYVDHPSYGMALIGRLLESRGYRVGIIARPDWRSNKDFSRLGCPRLCALVSGGNVDSMVANYTANKRLRRDDAYGASGMSDGRPDRASIVYTSRLRACFKGLPVILGGIEASLRRLAHYDYWDNAVRRSLLVDAKADMIVYGMAELSLVEVVSRLDRGESIADIQDVRGTVVFVRNTGALPEVQELPSFEQVSSDQVAFNAAFTLAYRHMTSGAGVALIQRHADRVVMQLPPARPLTTAELDASYELPYVRNWHPYYDQFGGVRGLETVRWSLTAVRGCSGECSFCGLAMHQGRIIQSRSERSLVEEARRLTKDPAFRGTISDVGGPTANLYGADCRLWDKSGPCAKRQCLMPEKCPSLETGYAKALSLYRALRRLPGVKHVFVASGLRYDLLMRPEAETYFRELCEYHVSGQLKVAPEHASDPVLRLMNKPPYSAYEEFVRRFERINRGLKSRKYLVNYFISAHPGCGLNEAVACADALAVRHMRPEQVQDFIPLPMTVAGCMYHTGRHPFTGEKIYVPKEPLERDMQRALFQPQNAGSASLVQKAMRIIGREPAKQKVAKMRRPGR